MNKCNCSKKNSNTPSLDPMELVKTGYAYWESRTLHTAVKLDIFSKLHRCEMSASKLAEECRADERGMEILLIACSSMGLLEKVEGIYKNSLEADRFLVKGEFEYRGHIIAMFDSWYPIWENLYDAVKTGKPVSQKQHERGEDATRSYILGLHNRGLYQAEALSQIICLNGKKQLLDVGGGAGTFSIILCRKNPGLKAVVFDLPQTIKIAKEIITTYGMNDFISTYEGDYRNNPFTKNNDVILLESMIKQEPVKIIKKIIQKSYHALTSGGILLVDDQFLNSEKTGPLLAALIGENQLLQTPGGGGYCAEEIGEIITDTGFTKLSITPHDKPSPNILITAVKP